MRKGLVAILFLACAVLLAGNVVIYVGEDRNGPEITIPQKIQPHFAENPIKIFLDSSSFC